MSLCSCCQTGANGAISNKHGWSSSQELLLDSPENSSQTFDVQKGFHLSHPRKFMILYYVMEMTVFIYNKITYLILYIMPLISTR